MAGRRRRSGQGPFLVDADDQAIPTEAERQFAKRMGATTVEVAAVSSLTTPPLKALAALMTALARAVTPIATDFPCEKKARIVEGVAPDLGRCNREVRGCSAGPGFFYAPDCALLPSCSSGVNGQRAW
jgi:hypothetical protein